MKEAVIVSAVRTAVGRAPRGRLRRTRPEKLGVTVLNELLRRTPGLMPTDIDDVVIGNSTPEAEQGLNLGRVLVMATGLPDQVSFEMLRWTSAVRDTRAGVGDDIIREKLGLSPISWIETHAKIKKLVEQQLVAEGAGV